MPSSCSESAQTRQTQQCDSAGDSLAFMYLRMFPIRHQPSCWDQIVESLVTTCGRGYITHAHRHTRARTYTHTHLFKIDPEFLSQLVFQALKKKCF